MKTTRLFILSPRFTWDCWKCGSMNVFEFPHDGFFDVLQKTINGKHQPVLTCAICKSKRKGRIGTHDKDGNPFLSSSPFMRRLRKLRKQSDFYRAKLRRNYLKSHPEPKKKGKKNGK